MTSVAKIKVTTLKVGSPVFKHEDYIPEKYTCDGENINPPLSVQNIPEEAKSLVLMIEDPDTLFKINNHWTVWNIGVDGIIKENSIPGIEGINSWGKTHYQGPCPPIGTHRYIFKIYALDTMLKFDTGVNKISVEKAMLGHIVGSGSLIGLYKKKELE